MTKLLLILLIVLVVFGAGKLPKIMGDVGKGVKALRDGLKDDDVETKPTAEVQIPVNKKEDV